MDLFTLKKAKTFSKNMLKFSTTENDTGRTWLDGRHIYSKYISLDNVILPEADWYKVAENTAIDKIVDYHGGLQMYYYDVFTDFALPNRNSRLRLANHDDLYFYYADAVDSKNLWLYIEYLKPAELGFKNLGLNGSGVEQTNWTNCFTTDFLTANNGDVISTSSPKFKITVRQYYSDKTYDSNNSHNASTSITLTQDGTLPNDKDYNTMYIRCVVEKVTGYEPRDVLGEYIKIGNRLYIINEVSDYE